MQAKMLLKFYKRKINSTKAAYTRYVQGLSLSPHIISSFHSKWHLGRYGAGERKNGDKENTSI
jgi:hypothetical protein